MQVRTAMAVACLVFLGCADGSEVGCRQYADRGVCFAQTSKCSTGSDCPTGNCRSDGRCAAWSSCSCVSDSDCPKGHVCYTNDTVCGLCLQAPATCTSGNDCQPDSTCTAAGICQVKCACQ